MTESPSPEPSAVWGRSRILITTGILATFQGLLFLSLSRWPTLPVPHGGQPFTVRLDPMPRDSRRMDGWSADPRQFSSNLREGRLPSRKSESQGEPEYPLFRWETSPRWLGASAGVEWQPRPVGESMRGRPDGQGIDGPIQGPVIRPRLLGGESSVALRGDLAPLAFEAITPPPTSQVGDILPSTVIELVISPGGDVIRARLASGCGNADADRAALSWSRGLRFLSRGSNPGTGGVDPAEWTTGELVLHWNTRPASQR